jgi:AraC-like DNA-binding protein
MYRVSAVILSAGAVLILAACGGNGSSMAAGTSIAGVEVDMGGLEPGTNLDHLTEDQMHQAYLDIERIDSMAEFIAAEEKEPDVMKKINSEAGEEADQLRAKFRERQAELRRELHRKFTSHYDLNEEQITLLKRLGQAKDWAAEVDQIDAAAMKSRLEAEGYFKSEEENPSGS